MEIFGSVSLFRLFTFRGVAFSGVYVMLIILNFKINFLIM